jgi:hypothetical protein
VTLGEGRSRWISMHKASAGGDQDGDQILLIEDISDYELLEQELLKPIRTCCLTTCGHRFRM